VGEDQEPRLLAVRGVDRPTPVVRHHPWCATDSRRDQIALIMEAQPMLRLRLSGERAR